MGRDRTEELVRGDVENLDETSLRANEKVGGGEGDGESGYWLPGRGYQKSASSLRHKRKKE